MRLTRSGICLLALVFLVGCGGKKVKFPDTVPLSGKVTLDGEPLPDATVVFTPSNPKAAGAIGTTNASGEYELQTMVGPERKSGAVPGDYKVHISTMLPPVVAKNEKPAKPMMAVQLEKVPEKYRSFTLTVLKATVGKDGGKENFELKSK